MIGRNSNIVVLTGAGISAESGLKTFRDNDGLWEQHRVEEVATPEAFQTNPELVYRFYNARRAQIGDPAVRPNSAHVALAELEKACQGAFLLVTQNVDNLHHRAGSHNVIAMHGQLNQARCVKSGKVVECSTDFDSHTPCSCCQPPSSLRPHIVWFGEVPLQMDIIQQALCRADLFIAIGTSGQVYPAAGFAALAQEYGARTVELNFEKTGGAFDEGHYGAASLVVPEFVKGLIGENYAE